MAHPQPFAADGSALVNHMGTNEYGFHQPQPMAAGYPGQQTYHSADGTQAYTVDEYGRGTYWQLPAAPRLPSAAARGWADQTHGHHSMHLYAPWAAAPHHHHQLAHPQQHHHPHHAYSQGQVASQVPPHVQHQPQHHQEIEQQMLLQHHLAKLQESHQAGYHPEQAHTQYDPSFPTHGHGTSFSEHQSHGGAGNWHQAFAAPAYPGHPQAPLAGDRQFELGSANRLANESYSGYDPRQPHAASHHPHQVLPAQQPDVHHQQQAYWAPHAANGRQDAGLRAEQGHSQLWTWHQHRHSLGNSSYGSGYTQAEHQRNAAGSWHMQQQQHYPLDAGQHAFHAPAEQQSQAPRGQWTEGPTWNGQQQHGHHPPQLQAQDGSREPDARENHVTADATQEKPPGPPSPDTLDKSGVPLSAFGAEIVWHACAVLSEPSILTEAFSDEGTSPSSGSSDSSPLLSTPQTSPHSPSSGNAKWIEAPSSLLSSMELEPGSMQNSNGWSPVRHRGEQSSAASASDSPSEQFSAHALHLHDAPHYHQSSPMQISSPNSGQPSPTVRAAESKKRFTPREGLTRTKSRERSRAAVLSVLGLVPPHLRWTISEDRLPSLVEATSRSTSEARSRGRARRSGSPRDPAPGFVSNGEVNPAFRRFAHQVLAQTLLSPTAFLLAVLYALRVPLLAVDGSGAVDPEALEVFASPPSAAPFKLFTLGLMIANKHLDDNTFLNKTWNEVTGIPLAELNRMEQYYLMRSNYEVAVPDQTWTSFLYAVRQREQAKVAAAHLVKLHESIGGGLSGDHSRRRSAASDETSRRVLLALDDISAALGGIEPFALPPQSCSPGRHSSDGGDEGRGRVAQGQGTARTSEVRPTSALHHNHQHCQSAPVCASDLRSLFSTSVHGGGGSCAGEVARLSSDSPRQGRRPTLEAVARSLSDHAKDTVASRRSTGSSSASSSSASTSSTLMMHDAPLAPSALLELLNSGRSLARAH